MKYAFLGMEEEKKEAKIRYIEILVQDIHDTPP